MWFPLISLHLSVGSHFRLQLRCKNLRVSVDRGHETKSHSSANSLGNLALIDRTKASLVSVLDTSHGGHIFGDDGEVLLLTGCTMLANLLCCIWIAEDAKDPLLLNSSIKCVDRGFSCPEYLDRSYLVQAQWAQVQSIKGISRRSLTLAPFLLLNRAEIVGSIDITSLPITSLEFLQCSTLVLDLLVFEEAEPVGKFAAGCESIYPHTLEISTRDQWLTAFAIATRGTRSSGGPELPQFPGYVRTLRSRRSLRSEGAHGSRRTPAAS